VRGPVLLAEIFARVLDPIDSFAAIVDADNVNPAVIPSANDFDVADLVLLPLGRFVPPAAAIDINVAIVVDIERRAGGELALSVDGVHLPLHFGGGGERSG
jgi:hypothetical protein